MSCELRFPVTLRLRSPFLFESLEASGFAIDGPALRDRNGTPILPGDHLRGHLSHAIRALGQTSAKIAKLHERLFGAASAKGTDGESDVPLRGIIDVPDFRADPLMHLDEAQLDPAVTTPRTEPLPRSGTQAAVRVEIDPKSGAANEGKLQFVELVAPQGAVVTFTGTIGIRAEDGEANVFRDLLEDAFRLIRTVGGAKTVGFGEVLADRTIIAASTRPTTVPRPAPAVGDRFEVTVTFDRPILVDGWSNASNLFRGGTVVPGGAIKGALATALTASNAGPAACVLDGALGKALTRMLVSHAFPLVETKGVTRSADRAVPLSLVAAKCRDGRIRYVEAIDPSAIEALIVPAKSVDHTVTDHGVAHAIDWKREVERAVRAAIERPESDLERSPRGRVAIDEKGVAERGKLFVVAPVETAGRKWRFIVDRNGSDDVAFRELLEEIAAGVSGIGRTGARMTVDGWESKAVPLPELSRVTIGGTERDVHVVRLETGAMLTDPCASAGWKDQYAAAFAALSGRADIELVTHFARRKTIGGYISQRHRRYDAKDYVTSELTLPGSVFVLAGGGAAAFLEAALRTGLGAVQFRNGKAEVLTDWRKTPFVPENGWGRISVDRIEPGVRTAVLPAEEG